MRGTTSPFCFFMLLISTYQHLFYLQDLSPAIFYHKELICLYLRGLEWLNYTQMSVLHYR